MKDEFVVHLYHPVTRDGNQLEGEWLHISEGMWKNLSASSEKYDESVQLLKETVEKEMNIVSFAGFSLFRSTFKTPE